MLRRIALIGTLALLVSCGLLSWLAIQPGWEPFIAAGAADLRVEELRPGERRIAYRVTNPEDGWQTTVARQLRWRGWRLEGDRYAWGDTEDYWPAYSRTQQFWFVRLDERAELRGQRDYAEILVRRTIKIMAP
jgi:hypothetical protein